MTTDRNVLTAVLLLGAAFMSPACSRSKPARFFILEPMPPAAESPRGDSGGLTVGLDAVHIPAYLNRSQLVTRASDVEIGVAEYLRWAEPLESSVPRMLAEYLEREAGVGSVSFLPLSFPPEPDRTVSLELLRFDGARGKTVRLSSRYQILDRDRSPLLGPVRSDISVNAEDGSAEALVRAMRQALAELARELATALSHS